MSAPSARVVVLVGASGSGKSPLVRAGLIPALRRGAIAGSADGGVATMAPGASPFDELRAALRALAEERSSVATAIALDGPGGILRVVGGCSAPSGRCCS